MLARGTRLRVLTGLLLVVVAVPLARLAFPPRFDRDIWIAGYSDSSKLDARDRMVSDLRRHHLHPGMTRAEVVSLLGPPSSREGGDLVYMMGFAHDVLSMLLGGMDPEYLELDFDRNGRLTQARVRSA